MPTGDAIPLIDRLLPAFDHLGEKGGRPIVTLSYAQSLDGSIALKRGEPLQLSGEESLEITHRLRAAHEAILVGIGTVLADDPKLTVRLVQGPDPLPVVLDSHLRLPPGARLLQNDRKPWVFTAAGAALERRTALEALGARVISVPEDPPGGVDLTAVLDCLGESGFRSVMVEGGARVISSFLQKRLADQAVITIAPVFAGGLRAVEDLAGGGGNIRLEEMIVEPAGKDLIVSGRIRYR